MRRQSENTRGKMKVFDGWTQLEKGKDGCFWISPQAWVPTFKITVKLEGNEIRTFIGSTNVAWRIYNVPAPRDLTSAIDTVILEVFDEIRNNMDKTLEYAKQTNHKVKTRAFCIDESLTLQVTSKELIEASISVGMGIC